MNKKIKLLLIISFLVVGAGIGVYLIISSPPVDKEKEEAFENTLDQMKNDGDIDWGDEDIEWPEGYEEHEANCPECCEYFLDEDGNATDEKVDPDCECKDDCN